MTIDAELLHKHILMIILKNLPSTKRATLKHLPHEKLNLSKLKLVPNSLDDSLGLSGTLINIFRSWLTANTCEA